MISARSAKQLHVAVGLIDCPSGEVGKPDFRAFLFFSCGSWLSLNVACTETSVLIWLICGPLLFYSPYTAFGRAPTIAADRQVARNAAARAFQIRVMISGRRSGIKAPKPATVMPTEPILAKPQVA